MKNIFLLEKPSRILIFLRNNKSDRKTFKGRLANEINATFSHTSNILVELEKGNIIQSEKEGTRVYITLTKEGKELADNIIKIMNIIK